MINLEQIKLLESKIVKALDFIERLATENNTLRQQEAELQTRLESYQKRIDELEVLIVRFKEDQTQIEESVLSALDRLSQFEKAFEKAVTKKGIHAAASKVASRSAGQEPAKPAKPAKPDSGSQDVSDEKTCFEIPSAETQNSLLENADDNDIPDPLESAMMPPEENGELDIF